MVFSGRTDLASEAHSLWKNSAEANTSLPGVIASEETQSGMRVSCVKIIDDSGAEALGKPKGNYYTLELEDRIGRGDLCFEDAASLLAKLIGNCITKSKFSSILIAALGNPDITPDALGSIAASNILVTRHLKESSPEHFSAFRSTTLLRTGVLGTTGIESAVQVKTFCEELNPDLVIAIDALAGADTSRLCKTIQICNTGIAPGSGVGNNRAQLDLDYLGVPVIGIGMPTVIDAGIIGEHRELSSMFVTPKDIDNYVRDGGKLIGYGINLTLHNGLTVSDIDMLVG